MSDMLPEGVSFLDFQLHGDERGGLIVGEAGVSVPFPIERVYTIFHSKSDVVRGCHAHTEMRQLILNVTGSFELLLDDGKIRKTVKMKYPGQGVLITGYVWRELKNFSENSVINCFADKKYVDCIYINTYEKFMEGLDK
jgi:dTDP-4-dehydrorhamnose 3,5-epimerase-like enzyme